MANKNSGPEPVKKPDQTPAKSPLEKLAQRSTGLPEDISSQRPEDSNPSRMRLAGLGLQTAVTTALAVLAGRWLDQKFGWQYVATLSLALFFLVGNLYLLIKEAEKMNK